MTSTISEISFFAVHTSMGKMTARAFGVNLSQKARKYAYAR